MIAVNGGMNEHFHPLFAISCSQSFDWSQPGLSGGIWSVLQHGQTVVFLDELSRGFMYFCFRKHGFFAYSTCYLLNET